MQLETTAPQPSVMCGMLSVVKHIENSPLTRASQPPFRICAARSFTPYHDCSIDKQTQGTHAAEEKFQFVGIGQQNIFEYESDML
jgi:hypothetical protein